MSPSSITQPNISIERNLACEVCHAFIQSAGMSEEAVRTGRGCTLQRSWSALICPRSSKQLQCFLLLFAAWEQEKIGICCWLQMWVEVEKPNLSLPGGEALLCLWRERAQRGGREGAGRGLCHHSDPKGGIIFLHLGEMGSCDCGWMEAIPSPPRPTSTQTVPYSSNLHLPAPSCTFRTDEGATTPCFGRLWYQWWKG